MKTGMGKLLRNRFMIGILLSITFLQLGIWVRNFAVLMFVMEKTNGSALAVSLISVAEFAPIFIFSFIGGVWADRWKPKKTMVWCDIGSAISVAFVLLALLLGTWKVIFLATLVSSILSQFSQPSSMKLFKKHVPEDQLQSGMSMFQSVIAVFTLLGPVLGTLCYYQFGISVSIGLVSVCFLLSATVLSLLPADVNIDNMKHSNSIRTEMAQGLHYIKDRQILLILGTCFCFTGLGIGFIQPLGIFLITDRLGLPKEYLQWMLSLNGMGMILGGALTVVLSKFMQARSLLAVGLAVNALCMVISGLSTFMWLTLLAQFFIGMVTPGFQVAVQTLILKNTEQAYIGRVNGLLSPLFMGSMLITMSMSGWLKDQLSVMVMYLLAGAFFGVGLLITAPLFRKTTLAEAKGMNIL
ncbi:MULTISPECIES: MFS transporter [unclassified Paenibacillus]|jgi:MFS transporter, DHA3 family, macrolide efflux protein|uniref:MFS transporter n=2 Tax=Paenibacillus TaxID=44249 RepID=UPI0004F5E14C|nr:MULTISPECIES: MFS transporter [unclassified Paenibacillus]AIQ31431.1 MFS transporter [Paenibacillus sp. FSL P4-0081]OMF28253.1 MFS transporter [Paenibacillus sp. FSL H8-0259]